MMARIRHLLREMRGPLAWGRLSYAQEGEDLVLDRLLEGKPKGFYVEVGCHHPFRFSNTYLFYRRGWRGLCMDPMPGTIRSFRRWRPRDLVIEAGVSEVPGLLEYHIFNETALNTFDSALAAQRDGFAHYRLLSKKMIRTESLAAILDAHSGLLADGIDFLSVDAEGMDLEVLSSNDWQRFRPRAVVAECLDPDMAAVGKDPIQRFMDTVGYVPYAKTGQSMIFVPRDSGDPSQ